MDKLYCFVMRQNPTQVMLVWTLGCALALVSGVICEADFNCDSSQQVFSTLDRCDYERSLDFGNFTAGDNVIGSKVIDVMTAVCMTYPDLLLCLNNMVSRCSQLSTTLKPVVVNEQSRLCSGNKPADWILAALKKGPIVSKRCIAGIVRDTQCQPSLMDLPLFEENTIQDRLTMTQRYVSDMFKCLREKLPNTIKQHPTCNVAAKDVLLIWFSKTSLLYQLSLGFSAYDSEFELIKEFVSV